MPMNNRLMVPRNTFTPRSIAGLGAWFDATDLSTLSQTSDGATPVAANNDPVAFWRCKVTGTALTQGIDANRPLYKSAGLNSRQTLDFDGSNDILFSTTGSLMSVFKNVSGGTLIGVRSFTYVGAFRVAAIWSVNGGAGSRLNISHNTSAAAGILGGRRLDGDTVANVTYTNIDNTPGIITGLANWGSAVATVRLNGTQVGQSSPWLTAGSTSNTDSAFVAIGGAVTTLPSTTGSNYLGQFSELLAWPRVLTASEIARIERYLANKWGIAIA